VSIWISSHSSVITNFSLALHGDSMYRSFFEDRIADADFVRFEERMSVAEQSKDA
jgi:hypothetical protein